VNLVVSVTEVVFHSGLSNVVSPFSSIIMVVLTVLSLPLPVCTVSSEDDLVFRILI